MPSSRPSAAASSSSAIEAAWSARSSANSASGRAPSHAPTARRARGTPQRGRQWPPSASYVRAAEAERVGGQVGLADARSHGSGASRCTARTGPARGRCRRRTAVSIGSASATSGCTVRSRGLRPAASAAIGRSAVPDRLDLPGPARREQRADHPRLGELPRQRRPGQARTSRASASASPCPRCTQ